MGNMDSIRSFKDILFERGRKYGFTDMEAYIQSSKSFEVSVFKGEIDRYNISKDMGLCFRGLYNGKMGYAYTELIDESVIDMLIKNASENAESVENNEVDEIFEGSAEYKNFNNPDSGLSDIPPEEKIKFAMDMEKAAYAADKRVSSTDDCLFADMEEEKTIINSKGLHVSFTNNMAIAYAAVIVRDGSDVKVGENYKTAVDFKDLNPSELSKEAVEEAVSMIGASPVKSGDYRVVLRHDAAFTLLKTFAPVFFADNVQKGLSLLKGKLGSTIGGKYLTIVDDPFVEDSFSSTPFDSEGVASRYKEVVSEGKLVTLLYSLKTCRKDGMESTGNGFRASYKSPVTVAPTNMYIKPGDKKYNELLKQMGCGIVITDIQGTHSGANQISGDFSLSAKGYYVEDGKVIRPVEQITMAGNFYNVLMAMEGAADDLKFSLPLRGSTFGSPSVLIKKLAISGK
jgi:Predicted Zn-dependent proteases and their inactivated homologs